MMAEVVSSGRTACAASGTPFIGVNGRLDVRLCDNPAVSCHEFGSLPAFEREFNLKLPANIAQVLTRPEKG